MLGRSLLLVLLCRCCCRSHGCLLLLFHELPLLLWRQRLPINSHRRCTIWHLACGVEAAAKKARGQSQSPKHLKTLCLRGHLLA